MTLTYAASASGSSPQLSKQKDGDSDPRNKDQTTSCHLLELAKDVEEAPIVRVSVQKQAKVDGPDAVNITADDDIVSDTLSALVLFDPLYKCKFTSNRVLIAVQRVASSRCYALGLQLGFSDDQVRRICDGMLLHADKLLAIYAQLRSRVDEVSAESQLLDACQKITPPIHHAVVEELHKMPS